VYFSGLPEPGAEEGADAEDAGDAGLGGAVRFPHLMLGVLTLFLYVGVEVIAGDTIINYGASQGIALSTARFFASFTLTCMLVGYLLGIVVTPTYLSQRTILKVSAGMGVLFALGALSTHGVVSVTCIGLLGLANAMVWPSIWPLALDGLGRYTRIGSSLLILAIGGGAVMPLLYGWLADGVGAQHAYWLVVPIYLFIGGYAFIWERVKS
jgi:fucose permease